MLFGMTSLVLPPRALVERAEAIISLARMGEGCTCVATHSPAAYVVAKHHIKPQSWGGLTVPSNLIDICPNTHTATHRLLDDYVRNGGDPGWEARRKFGVLARALALKAWEQRPSDNPGITSLHFAI